jgi:hypothetical protein
MNESITDSLSQLGLSDGQAGCLSGTKQAARQSISPEKVAMH